jgi:hypothetical protein
MTPMTEEEWNGCTDSRRMLRFLHDKASNRKMRLFACGCGRRVRDFFCTERIILGVEVADGTSGRRDLDSARDMLALIDENLTLGIEFPNAGPEALGPVRAVIAALDGDAISAALESQIVRKDLRRSRKDEKAAQSALLRHIIGNPFQPYPAPTAWPSAVFELAQALYDGAGDRLVLADAMEEAGQGELALHFRGEEWHPKGCFAMDLILGKE